MSEHEDYDSGEIITDPGEIMCALKGAHEQMIGHSLSESSSPTTVLTDQGEKVGVRKIAPNVCSKTVIPAAKELQRMAEKVGIVWEEVFAERVIAYWASDERVDRHGDIVRQKWDFANFANNPVMPYCHEWDKPPIGNIIHWKVMKREDKGYSGKALFTLNLFASEEISPFADSIFRLVSSGFLKTSSVGFYPTEIVKIVDQKEREKLGLGPFGYVYTKSELVEHSPCTVPANAGAFSILRNMREQGTLREADAAVIRELNRQSVVSAFTEIDLDQFIASDAAFVSMLNELLPDLGLSLHKDIDEPFILEVKEKKKQDPVLLSVLDRLDEQSQMLSDIREMMEEEEKDTPKPVEQNTNCPLEGLDEDTMKGFDEAAKAFENFVD